MSDHPKKALEILIYTLSKIRKIRKILKSLARKICKAIAQALAKILQSARFQMEMVLIVKAVDMIVIHENGGLVLVLVEPIDLSENFMESSTNIRVPRLFFTLQKQASEFRDWIVVIYYSLLVVVVY